MFDFDFSKLLLIGVIALIFIPPKDLPAAMRTVGQLIGKARRMAADFQGQFNEALREAELDGLKEDLGKLKQAASLEASMAHIRDVASAVAATAPISATPPVSASVEETAAPSLEELRAIQAAESLDSSAGQAMSPVDPLPAAVLVETRHVAEAAHDVVMGPLAPAETEKLAANPVAAAPLPPSV
jgi:sec-independent protein translocase protein TatB